MFPKLRLRAWQGVLGIGEHDVPALKIFKKQFGHSNPNRTGQQDQGFEGWALAAIPPSFDRFAVHEQCPRETRETPPFPLLNYVGDILAEARFQPLRRTSSEPLDESR
jgi:hypothetical protein